MWWNGSHSTPGVRWPLAQCSNFGQSICHSCWTYNSLMIDLRSPEVCLDNEWLFSGRRTRARSMPNALDRPQRSEPLSLTFAPQSVFARVFMSSCAISSEGIRALVTFDCVGAIGSSTEGELAPHLLHTFSHVRRDEAAADLCAQCNTSLGHTERPLPLSRDRGRQMNCLSFTRGRRLSPPAPPVFCPRQSARGSYLCVPPALCQPLAVSTRAVLDRSAYLGEH